MKNYTTAYTHAGDFHADDVFSTAFIKLLNPNIEIKRVTKVPKGLDISKNLIYDIGAYDGYKKFDHHQVDKEYRENGIPYAAFGLLWREFGKELGISDYVHNKIEQKLVQGIDACDNGVFNNILSAVIDIYNPFWDENTTHDDQFNKAVEIASNILKRTIDREISGELAREDVLKYAENMKNHVLVLEEYRPISQDLFNSIPDALFYIYPSNRGGYNIQAIGAPTEENKMAKRAYFPECWLGNPDISLGMTFCHPNNFLTVADTLENAINIANIAVNNHLSKN